MKENFGKCNFECKSFRLSVLVQYFTKLMCNISIVDHWDRATKFVKVR